MPSSPPSAPPNPRSHPTRRAGSPTRPSARFGGRRNGRVNRRNCSTSWRSGRSPTSSRSWMTTASSPAAVSIDCPRRPRGATGPPPAAPPRGDNTRIFARRGVDRLSTAPALGIVALLREANITGKVTPRDVTFGLAPRLNAAGRLGDAKMAATLLLSEDAAEGTVLAQELDQENRRRQELTERVLTEAAARVEEAGWGGAPALVVSGEGWHPGVIGIVASHLKERYSRPVVMIAVDDGVGKGSARSIEALPMVDALAACADLLLRYGGPAMAAGLTIAPEQIEMFRARFLEEAGRRLRPEDLVPRIAIDADLRPPDLAPPLARELEQVAPV